MVAGGIHEPLVAAEGTVGQGAEHGTLLVVSEATPRAWRATGRPARMLSLPADDRAILCFRGKLKNESGEEHDA